MMLLRSLVKAERCTMIFLTREIRGRGRRRRSRPGAMRRRGRRERGVGEIQCPASSNSCTELIGKRNHQVRRSEGEEIGVRRRREVYC
jgi:hypothetical protein